MFAGSENLSLKIMLFIHTEAIKISHLKGIPADHSFKMQNKLILKASMCCYSHEDI